MDVGARGPASAPGQPGVPLLRDPDRGRGPRALRLSGVGPGARPVAALGGGCSPGNPGIGAPSHLATLSSQGGAAADVDHCGSREERRERVHPATVWYVPGGAGGPAGQRAGPRGRRPGEAIPGAPQPAGPTWALPVAASGGPIAASRSPPRDTLHARSAAGLEVAGGPSGQPTPLGGAAAAAGGGGAGHIRRAGPGLRGLLRRGAAGTSGSAAAGAGHVAARPGPRAAPRPGGPEAAPADRDARPGQAPKEVWLPVCKMRSTRTLHRTWDGSTKTEKLPKKGGANQSANEVQLVVAFGGRPCIGLRARPHFAARGAMKAQLERLSLHRVARWQQRLRTPAQQRVRQVAFLQDYFPVPEGGREALRPGQRQPGRPQLGRPRGPPPPARPPKPRPQGRPMPGSPPGSPPAGARAAPRQDERGRFTGEGVCPQHGAPACQWCRAWDRGVAKCCARGHTGHAPAGAVAVCLPVERGRTMSRPGIRRLPPGERRTAAGAMLSWLAMGSTALADGAAPRVAQPARGGPSRPPPDGRDEPRHKRQCLRPPRVAGRRGRAEREEDDNNADSQEVSGSPDEVLARGGVRRKRARREGGGAAHEDPTPGPSTPSPPPPPRGDGRAGQQGERGRSPRAERAPRPQGADREHGSGDEPPSPPLGQGGRGGGQENDSGDRGTSHRDTPPSCDTPPPPQRAPGGAGRGAGARLRGAASKPGPVRRRDRAGREGASQGGQPYPPAIDQPPLRGTHAAPGALRPPPPKPSAAGLGRRRTVGGTTRWGGGSTRTVARDTRYPRRAYATAPA